MTTTLHEVAILWALLFGLNSSFLRQAHGSSISSGRRSPRRSTRWSAQVQQDRSILAAILCGSLSHDTVWAKSDIDLVLVTIDDSKVASGDRSRSTPTASTSTRS